MSEMAAPPPAGPTGMGLGRRAQLSPILERIAVFVGVFGVVLRWTAGGGAVGTNLFIHLLFWIALALWLVARALDGGATWHFSGAEFPLLAVAIASLLSVQRAEYKLPALDRAMGFLSLALLFVFLANAVGGRTLLSLVAPTLLALAAYALLQRFLLFPRLLREYDPAVFGPMSTEMKWRIEGNRVFATFIGPNQFAGFLALLLPIATATVLGARARLLRGIPVALGLAALALTKSIGAAVGLASGAATFAALWYTRERGRGIAVILGLGVAAAVLLAALFTPLLEKVEHRSFSMHVRRAYWQAAGRTIARAPVLGVGLDNYQDYFPQDKPETQTETRFAHNDYLQILAETGIVGGLAFAALVAFALWRSLGRGDATDVPAPSLPHWLVPVSAVAGLLASWLVAGTLPGDVALVVAPAWLGWYFLERRTDSPVAGPLPRIGAASGLVALLVHMTVEFDLYEPALACALFASLALVAILSGKVVGARLAPAISGASGALLLLVVFPLLVWVTPRALAAEGEVEQATRALYELDAGARKGRPPAQLVREILLLSQSAQAHNPHLVEAYRLQAEGEARAWRRIPKGASSLPVIEPHEDTATQALENALRIRPRSAALHSVAARLHEEFARPYRSLSPGSPRAEARAEEHQRLALRHQELAVFLYPTFAPYQADLARLLTLDGRREEAVPHYREALRLSALAAEERYPLDRMQVDRAMIQKALDDILKPKERP